MTIQLHSLTFDCADAAVLGEFWAQALGVELDPGAGKEFASIGLRDFDRSAPRWLFARVPEGRCYRPVAEALSWFRCGA